MVLWIGVDDTDSLQGMCTTYLATELVRELTQRYDLIGYPRLVRLNPNIPWKTRGNAALCLRVGSGRGPTRLVANIGGRDVESFARASTGGDIEDVAARVGKLVERWSCLSDETTNPGFAVLASRPPPSLYWRSVREIVSKREALEAGRGRGRIVELKNGRGVIGALASTAWRPRDRTYEIITYRQTRRWGTRRDIDSRSVIEMDRAFPSTFNNYDPVNRRVVIAPHSPCPVLFGIRGDDPSTLTDAMRAVHAEPAERWMVFETNQGTDDHVLPHSAPRPRKTVRLEGDVSASPRVLLGGHVVARVGSMDVAAYEPSKQFRAIVRSLVPGDRVIAQGAVRDSPRTLNLEKLCLVSAAVVSRKVSNPSCPGCGKRTKSVGKAGGFRCPRCRRTVPLGAAVWERVERPLTPGWYEPPVSARRHLSKPLKRGTSLVPHRRAPTPE